MKSFVQSNYRRGMHKLSVTELWDVPEYGKQTIAPGQQAKSLLLNIGSIRAMIVMAGDVRLDNKKCRLAFGVRPRMLAAKVVETSTGHAIDAISPIGMACRIPVYCDLSLRRFEDIYVPAGTSSRVIKMPVTRMIALMNARWVDVSRPAPAYNETARIYDYDFVPA